MHDYIMGDVRTSVVSCNLAGRCQRSNWHFLCLDRISFLYGARARVTMKRKHSYALIFALQSGSVRSKASPPKKLNVGFDDIYNVSTKAHAFWCFANALGLVRATVRAICLLSDWGRNGPFVITSTCSSAAARFG